MSKNTRPIIFIGADHRGFELKKKLIGWLKSQGYTVKDCGNSVYDPEDDYPDFVKNVVARMTNDSRQKTKDDQFGLVICGSGVGVAIAANRYSGIRCALGFDADQIAHGRAHDHINMLALPSDYISEGEAQKMIDAFIKTKPVHQEKYLRRLKKLDSECSPCQCRE